jgi:thymidylate synthase (FAD)
LKVTLVASSTVAVESTVDGPVFPVETKPYFDVLADDPAEPVTEADAIAEFAGRACYKSWSKPNPATAANSDYLANIIRQGHFSVLEHASASFYVEGASRALLLELERHRFLSFSVVSQRYVDYGDTEPVIPPALSKTEGDLLASYYDEALEAYEDLTRLLTNRGLPRKQAREAARAVLPNAAPADFLVTGNLRAWRDVIAKRYHVAADAEIRQLAALILDHLREIAPHSVQDVPANPYGK